MRKIVPTLLVITLIVLVAFPLPDGEEIPFWWTLPERVIQRSIHTWEGNNVTVERSREQPYIPICFGPDTDGDGIGDYCSRGGHP